MYARPSPLAEWGIDQGWREGNPTKQTYHMPTKDELAQRFSCPVTSVVLTLGVLAVLCCIETSTLSTSRLQSSAGRLCGSSAGAQHSTGCGSYESGCVPNVEKHASRIAWPVREISSTVDHFSWALAMWRRTTIIVSFARFG